MKEKMNIKEIVKMDIQEKIQFWKKEIERAEENGFYFDTASMREVVDTIENLQIEIDALNLVLETEKGLIKELEKEIEQLKRFVEYLQSRNKDMININGWHMKTNKHLKERISQRKGKEIAELIYKWLDEKHIHPDDFDSLFVPELLEKLEKDE